MKKYSSATIGNSLLCLAVLGALLGLSRSGFIFSPRYAAATAETITDVVSIDSDGDGLNDEEELVIYHTDPQNADTDDDGYNDGQEITNGYSPLHDESAKLVQVDSDNDYLNDAWELILGTGLMEPDSDNDLYLDGTEVAASFDPLDPAPRQLEKLIEVDLGEQRLRYYFDDQEIGSFLISGGRSGWPTPVGEFSVLQKYPVKYYGGPGFDYPNTKWNLLFVQARYNYYIHGTYWHNDFGTPKSHGCVNVRYEDMEPLYWWAQVGTRVVIK